MQTFYETVVKSVDSTRGSGMADYLVRVTESDLSRLNALQRLGGWGVWGNSVSQVSVK
jgi:hypothetical protein